MDCTTNWGASSTEHWEEESSADEKGLMRNNNNRHGKSSIGFWRRSANVCTSTSGVSPIGIATWLQHSDVLFNCKSISRSLSTHIMEIFHLIRWLLVHVILSCSVFHGVIWAAFIRSLAFNTYQAISIFYYNWCLRSFFPSNTSYFLATVRDGQNFTDWQWFENEASIKICLAKERTRLTNPSA